MKTRAVLAAVIAMTMIACDEDTTTPDSGTAIDSGTTPGTDSGPTPGTDSGPTPDGGGTEDAGGTPGGGCEEYAQAFCEQLMTCDAEIFLGRYETMAICLEVVEERCAGTGGTAVEDIPALEDPDACTAAITGSCADFFGASSYLDPRTPEACVPPPGPRELNDACSSDLQCGMGVRSADGETVRLRCAGSAMQIACGDGNCVAPDPPESSRNICQNAPRDPCNFWEGEFCTEEFDDVDGGTTDDGWRCRAVTYGDSGDECFPQTNMQCNTGLVCDPTSRRCMLPLDRDAACSTTRDLCDPAKSLTCVDDDPLDLSPDGHCEGTDYAPIGAQCGNFDEGGEDVTRVCSDYAFCNNSATTVCEAKDRVDEPCSLTPQDTCWPGYECRESTCMPPEPPDGC